jgi:hypothetical protein
MIPDFPQFKNIELLDKNEVEKFTSKFPHYSDFNFLSMWCWDIHNKVKISLLNDNLVVSFSDYLSGEEYLSFLGDNDVLKTAEQLIKFSTENYKKSFLKLIPEELTLNFKGSNFLLKEDRDAFDYIYLVEDLANMDHWSKNTSGKRIRQFIQKKHNYKVAHSTLADVSIKEYLHIFHKWAESKQIDNHFELNEFKAFEKLANVNDPNLRLLSLYENEKMIGFTLYELISNHYAISHFAKADKRHHAAIFDLLNWEEAKYLHKLGVKYYNWEQDLGIESLRYAKIKYRPAFLLRKLYLSHN